MLNQEFGHKQMKRRLKRLWTSDADNRLAADDPGYQEARGLVKDFYKDGKLSHPKISRLARVMNSAPPNLRLAHAGRNMQIGPHFDPPTTPGGHYTRAAQAQALASPAYRPLRSPGGRAVTSDPGGRARERKKRKKVKDD
jgi:hypothetical protein